MWSRKKWFDVTDIHDNTKSEITNSIIGMHCFSGDDIVEMFSTKSKKMDTSIYEYWKITDGDIRSWLALCAMQSKPNLFVLGFSDSNMWKFLKL